MKTELENSPITVNERAVLNRILSNGGSEYYPDWVTDPAVECLLAGDFLCFAGDEVFVPPIGRAVASAEVWFKPGECLPFGPEQWLIVATKDRWITLAVFRKNFGFVGPLGEVFTPDAVHLWTY